MAASIAARLAAAPEALALKLDCGAAIASDGAEDCTQKAAEWVPRRVRRHATHDQGCLVCCCRGVPLCIQLQASSAAVTDQQSVSLGHPSHLRLQRIMDQRLRVGRRPCSAAAPAGGAVAALHGPFACRQQGSVTQPFPTPRHCNAASWVNMLAAARSWCWQPVPPKLPAPYGV